MTAQICLWVQRKLIEDLGLEGQKHSLAVLGVGGKTQNLQTKVTVARISHVNGSVQKNVVLRTMPDPTGGLEVPQWHVHAKQWPHLKDLPILNTPEGLRVELILGNDQGYFHRSLQEYYHPTDIDAPVARLTPLGLTITGRLKPKRPELQGRVNMHQIANIFRVSAETSTKSDTEVDWLSSMGLKESLGTTLKPLVPKGPPKPWMPPGEGEPWVQVDKVRVQKDSNRPPVVNPEDRLALNILQTKTKATASGKAQAPVLWRNHVRPPNNYAQALRVWQNLRQKLIAKPEQYEAYHKSF